MLKYQPPIENRTTDELLEIVGDEENWMTDAVESAYKELKKRKVNDEKILKAKSEGKKLVVQQQEDKANESYSVIEFVLDPFSFIIILFFQWELKKDGFFKKAKQLRKIRIVFLIILFIITIFWTLI